MNRHSVPNATYGLPGRPINGGSKPRFYQFDDDVTRLVKWHPSPHGAKACYNELVASRIGQLLGAPILRGAVVYVPDEIIPGDHRADGAHPGFHFAVARMEGENFVPAQHYAEIENSSQLPFAAVHLAWLAIGDQEGHNQYLQRSESSAGTSRRRVRFMLIDMGFTFGSPAWTAGSVAAAHTSYQLPRHLAEKLSAAKLQPALDVVGSISEADIRSCFHDVPEEWNVTDAERDAAIRRALTTQVQVEQILRTGNPAVFTR
jgi:hypothetical protein